MLGKGNAFVIIRYDRGKPVRLDQVNPDWVKVDFADGSKAYVVKSPDKAYAFLNGTYLDNEILHFMLFSRDGIYGVDPITYNAAAIGEGIAAQKFTADFFRTGGAIKGTLETDQALGDDDYFRFMEHYKATAGNGETPLLEYGFKYKAINISPEASQLLQSKTFSINDIARIFSAEHLLRRVLAAPDLQAPGEAAGAEAVHDRGEEVLPHQVRPERPDARRRPGALRLLREGHQRRLDDSERGPRV